MSDGGKCLVVKSKMICVTRGFSQHFLNSAVILLAQCQHDASLSCSVEWLYSTNIPEDNVRK